MDNNILKYNINPLVNAIGKTPDQFTKEDIINFITANDIRVVNFRYIAGDGRLKTLNFPVSSLQYLDLILSPLEREWTAPASSPTFRPDRATSM